MNFDFNRLYLTVDGRIGRQDFWIGVVGLIVVGIVTSLIIVGLFGPLGFFSRLLQFILQLVLAYPGYCLMAKRFQDRGRPATFAAIVIGISLLIGLLMLIGVTGSPAAPNLVGTLLAFVNLAIAIWVLVELGFMRGTVGENEYGPDPVAAM